MDQNYQLPSSSADSQSEPAIKLEKEKALLENRQIVMKKKCSKETNLKGTSLFLLTFENGSDLEKNPNSEL